MILVRIYLGRSGGAAKSLKYGAPDRIRTCGLCLRRAALYPAELRVPGRQRLAEAFGTRQRFQRTSFTGWNSPSPQLGPRMGGLVVNTLMMSVEQSWLSEVS